METIDFTSLFKSLTLAFLLAFFLGALCRRTSIRLKNAGWHLFGWSLFLGVLLNTTWIRERGFSTEFWNQLQSICFTISKYSFAVLFVLIFYEMGYRSRHYEGPVRNFLSIFFVIFLGSLLIWTGSPERVGINWVLLCFLLTFIPLVLGTLRTFGDICYDAEEGRERGQEN